MCYWEFEEVQIVCVLYLNLNVAALKIKESVIPVPSVS